MQNVLYCPASTLRNVLSIGAFEEQGTRVGFAPLSSSRGKTGEWVLKLEREGNEEESGGNKTAASALRVVRGERNVYEVRARAVKVAAGWFDRGRDWGEGSREWLADLVEGRIEAVGGMVRVVWRR